jgi:hypothetical protein
MSSCRFQESTSGANLKQQQNVKDFNKVTAFDELIEIFKLSESQSK